MSKKAFVIIAFILSAACAATVANGIDFGSDTSEFANDGECDDPRFVGAGMADNLSDANLNSDATDCRALVAASRIRLQRTRAQWDPAQCKAVDFGDDSSTFARDGDCDDPRFTGPGIYSIMLAGDARADATDCRALCASGEVWPK